MLDWPQNEPLILDGGLATELERHGNDLGDALWSARLLLDDPEAIRRVHRDYLAAGADCIISATYQATLPGLQRHGLTAQQSADLLRFAVQLAVSERDHFWTARRQPESRRKPLVAASVGPYGAFLANGAEYTGVYDIGLAQIIEFHDERWQVLAATDADILACETIPSFDEARALLTLLRRTPDRRAWISFSCRNGNQISDGSPIGRCARLLHDVPQIAAIGVNCTAPRFLPELIQTIRRESDKPIVVYPNSGERWQNGWVDGSAVAAPDFAQQAQRWRAAGAFAIGGCCRTTPQHVRLLRQALLS